MSTWGLTLIFDPVPSTYFRPPKHSLSPKITAVEVLMGIPPSDIYCSSSEIKFLIKAVNKDDLVTATHVKTLTRPSSLSSLLLSSLRRFERTHMSHSYTRDSINAFIRDNWNRRWNSPYNDHFLRNFISNLPQETIHSPLLDGNPLIANMVSDLLIGSSRWLAENMETEPHTIAHVYLWNVRADELPLFLLLSKLL